MKKSIVLAAVLLYSFAIPTLAAEYTKLVVDKSTIGFIYKQMNVPMEGSFKRFSSQLHFDPAKPEGGAASFDIDLSSIDTGATDADEEVRGKLWFNTKEFPRARFVSTAIKSSGANRFDVAGKLTIKGRTLNVSTPVTFRPEGNNAVFEGAFLIKRADFAIGEGIWSDFGTVANDVQIKFRLLAAVATANK